MCVYYTDLRLLLVLVTALLCVRCVCISVCIRVYFSVRVIVCIIVGVSVILVLDEAVVKPRPILWDTQHVIPQLSGTVAPLSYTWPGFTHTLTLTHH